MPVLGSYRQQPADTLDYDVDFSDWLPAGDTIVSATAVAVPATISVTNVISSPVVKVWCPNGVNGTTYKITVTATTNDGRVKQVEFRLKVKDD